MTKAKLSSREDQVVQQLKAGKTYKEIASALDIAESTARVHGSNALRKMRRSRMAVSLSNCVAVA